jgi:hypothetical protein
MINWIETNILDRINNPNLNFYAKIKKSNFEKVSFDIAATNVAKELQNLNKKIFVSFSGGYDSEFIVRKLHSLKIEFIPIIVHLETHSSEREYAYKTLRELNIKAKVLKLSNYEYFNLYVNFIHKKFNSFESSPIPIFLMNYVNDENGILIDGTGIGGMNCLPLHTVNSTTGPKQFENEIINQINENIINYNFVSQQIYYLREQESYWSYLYPNSFYIFFMQNPQIVVSMLDSILLSDKTWNDYKERIFQLTWRPKLREVFFAKRKFDYLKTISQIDSLRKYKPNHVVFFGDKQQLRNLITD